MAQVNVFDRIWRNELVKGGLPGKGPRSWRDAIVETAQPSPGRKILEVGSGTGMLSAELVALGSQCTLLDISPAAIELSRRVLDGFGLEAQFVVGDMFSMPFVDAAFDVVWSSGVLEHFRPSGTYEALREMARVCKSGGKLIALVPSAGGVFYRAGKCMRELVGKWHVGYERPVKSLAREAPSSLVLEREFITGVFSQARSLLPGLRGPALWTLRAIARGDDRCPWLSRFVGGYLLVSVFRRTE